MQNYVANGDHVEIASSPANYSAGDFVVKGSLFGVAMNAATTGNPVLIAREGAFDTLPKATGAAWTQGDAIYWDSTAGKMTKTSTSNRFVGTAYADAQSADTTGAVLLSNPVA